MCSRLPRPWPCVERMQTKGELLKPVKIVTSPLFPPPHPASLFENYNHYLSKNACCFLSCKIFFPLSLWHTWQATDAQWWGPTESIRSVNIPSPLTPPLPFTSLMFYIPVTYFCHLHCRFLRQKLSCKQWLVQWSPHACSVFLASTIK